jgi:serine phosphatase RsbU (regulator of sigma subunit)
LATDLARAATRRRVAQVLLRRAVASAGAVGGFVAVFTSYPQADVLAATGAFRADDWTDVGLLISELQPSFPRQEREDVPVLAVDDIRGAVGRRLAASGFAQLAWKEVTSGERGIGIVVLAWSDRVEPRSVDRDLLRAQVAMAGSTLQRAARYDVEHAIADTLQRSLLALPPLTTDRVRWSVLYRAGSAGLAGGDWYDLVEIDDERLGVVVGDIVGRGVEAAASMGQLRSATRALATQIDDPAELVAALDQFALNTGQGHFSSLAYLVLNTRDGHASYSIAGHPPPVVVGPDGAVSLLQGGVGPLLGMSCIRRGAAANIAPGSRLIMYTDGLVDRRGESVDVGIERLVSAIDRRVQDLDPDEACRDLVDRLLPALNDGEEARDDVALVVVDLVT